MSLVVLCVACTPMFCLIDIRCVPRITSRFSSRSVMCFHCPLSHDVIDEKTSDQKGGSVFRRLASHEIKACGHFASEDEKLSSGSICAVLLCCCALVLCALCCCCHYGMVLDDFDVRSMFLFRTSVASPRKAGRCPVFNLSNVLCIPMSAWLASAFSVLVV